MSKKIYLASSFAYSDKEKTEEHKEMMNKAERILEEKGFDVYNPSRLKIENAWSYSMYDWGKLVFMYDINALDNCDLVVFLSYGKENNAGSAWECGYAFANNKKVILVKMNPCQSESLMIMNSTYTQLAGLDELDRYDFEQMLVIKILDAVQS